MTPSNGSCLCGKVTFTAELRPGAGACHCDMCRKWCGGPLMSVHAQGKVEFTGKEHIKTFASSEWAERGFCANCGSSLYYHLLPNPNIPEGEFILSAGSLEQQDNLVFDHEVYVDHNPGWFQFAGEDSRKRMTEADIMAMYSGSE